jgi:uncharacterized membrane protein HdeD (DUF308 family)
MKLMQDDLTEVLRRAGGAWGWFLAMGVITIAAGVSMFFFTSQALYVIAIAFGVYLIVSGIFHFVGAFSVPGEEGWLRALYALLAALSVVVGVYLVNHKILSLLVLTLLIGFFWVFAGTLQLMIGIEYRALPNRGATIFAGVADIIAGWVLVFYPGIGTLALALLLGVWLVVRGVVLVAGSLQLRSVGKGSQELLSARHG